MSIQVEAENVSVDEVQVALNAIWASAISDADTRSEVTAILGTDDVPEAVPLVARPGEDNYGVLELIMIAATGRVVGTYTEKMLDKLFNDVIWPKLEARFGEGIRKRDNKSDGG